MSQVYICDGCGKTSEHKLATLGRALKRDYCADCVPRAKEFVLEVEQARKQLAEAFQIELAEIAARYETDNFKLPDRMRTEPLVEVVNG
mgnify:CR=1 FL=1